MQHSLLCAHRLFVPHCKLKPTEQTTPTVSPSLVIATAVHKAISVGARGKFGKGSQFALFKSWIVIQDVLVLFLV